MFFFIANLRKQRKKKSNTHGQKKIKTFEKVEEVWDVLCREEDVVWEVKNFPLAATIKPRLGTSNSFIEMMDDITKNVNKVTMPYILCHGELDKVADPNISQNFYQSSLFLCVFFCVFFFVFGYFLSDFDTHANPRSMQKFRTL